MIAASDGHGVARARQREGAVVALTRVMIVGCVRLYCDGLAAALARRDDVTVVSASSEQPTIESVRAAAPEVVIVDVQSSSLIDFVHVLRRECADVKVVAFAIEEQEQNLVACAEAGVAGYVTCDASIDDLVHVVHTVVRHDFVCPPRIAAALVRTLTARGVKSGSITPNEESLTGRERQILSLICEGLANKEIAQVCSISEATVKNHVHHLLEKHKLKTRTQLAARLSGAPRMTRGS
jgi:DNA-binding NarL/FixJ family response regulator